MMSKRVLIILNITLILVACKPKENLFLSKSAENLSDRELEELILGKNKEIETIKFERTDISLKINGEELKSGATIGIIKDSVIVVSLVPAMGYEISRIFCYKDKILVLDRIEKTFFFTSLQKNMEKYKIKGDYNDIEDLLIGKAFIYGNQAYGTRLKKNMEKGDEKLKFHYDILKNDLLIASQELTIRERGLLTEVNNIKEIQEKADIKIEYDQFNTVNGFIFPQKVMLSIDSPGTALKLVIEIGNIVINEQINAENNIPSRYQEAIIE